jgi:hypothetical protein
MEAPSVLVEWTPFLLNAILANRIDFRQNGSLTPRGTQFPQA